MEESLFFWAVLAVFFILLEIGTTALIAIWFVFGCLAAFVGAACGMDWMDQCYLFTGVSVVVFFLTRSLVRKIKPTKVPTNSDQLLGMEGVTLSEIDNYQANGRVQIGGLDWRAKSTSGKKIPFQTKIVVDRLEGVTVYVSPKISQDDFQK